MIAPSTTPIAKRPLHIGYLLNMYPRFSQTFVVNEILEVERQGVSVDILSLRRPTDGVFHESISRVRAQTRYVPENLRDELGANMAMQWRLLRDAPAAFLRAGRSVTRSRTIRWVDFMQAAHVLKWSRKQKLDHVHVHFGTNEANVAMLARRLGGPSYSMTLHAFDIFRDNVDRVLLAEKINASAFTVTVSEFNRRYLLDTVPGVDPERIRVNYNGIDLAWFADAGQARIPGTILSVGRLIEKKGFHHLVDAMGALKRNGVAARCTLIGEGPEHQRLQGLVEAAGLQKSVVLAGGRNQEFVRHELQRASCFVLPCVRAKDGNMDALPTVLLEAMACGCPAISTRLSGIPEIIEHERSGLLVEPEDVGALAGAIRRVLGDPVLAMRLSAGGQSRAEERFDVRRNVAVMREWWDEGATPECALRSRRAASLVGPSQVSVS